jgi:3'(2'), 5'-bisphosphate nucleotidase
MLNELCRIAAAAAAVTLRYYKRSISVTTKSDYSPLTEADRASHDYLVAALGKLTPKWPVISEESNNNPAADAGQAERYWLVDPLDGTKEFLKGTDEFTVNIALMEAGRPILGVVQAPALALTYYGERGTGAWRQQGSEAPAPLRTRAADPARLAVVASKDHAGPKVSLLLARVPGAELKSMGSSLKFCLVAEGKADLYLRDLPTMEWDTAAAQCIVEAAGGLVCELSGHPLRYGKSDLRNSAIITVGDPCFAWQQLLV